VKSVELSGHGRLWHHPGQAKHHRRLPTAPRDQETR
jgi:hypothetical protein